MLVSHYREYVQQLLRIGLKFSWLFSKIVIQESPCKTRLKTVGLICFLIMKQRQLDICAVTNNFSI
jgi:hypothetical protein